jgi:hypothetical protein
VERSDQFAYCRSGGFRSARPSCVLNHSRDAPATYASNLQELLFHCSEHSDVSPQVFAEFTGAVQHAPKLWAFAARARPAQMLTDPGTGRIGDSRSCTYASLVGRAWSDDSKDTCPWGVPTRSSPDGTEQTPLTEPQLQGTKSRTAIANVRQVSIHEQRFSDKGRTTHLCETIAVANRSR